MRLTTTPVPTAPCYTVIYDMKLMYLVFDGTINPAFEIECEFREGETIAIFQYNEDCYTLFVNDYAVAGVAPLSTILSYMDKLVMTVPILSYHEGYMAQRELPEFFSSTLYTWSTDTQRLVYGRAVPSDILRLKNAGFPVEASPLLIRNHLIRVLTGFSRNTLHITLSPFNYSGGWIVDQKDAAGFLNRILT